MDAFTELLPKTPGLLPKWLLFTSVLSIFNTIQALLSTTYTRRLYNLAPQLVTPLSARTFATWTLLSGIIRLYAAYHLTDQHVYRATLLTYVIAWAHFVSELAVFRTLAITGQKKGEKGMESGGGLAPGFAPMVVATGSLAWMVTVWGDYVR